MGLGLGLGLEVPLGGTLALGLGLALAVAGLVLAFMVLGLVFAAPASRLVVRGLTALGLEGEVTVLTPVASDLDSMLGVTIVHRAPLNSTSSGAPGESISDSRT